MQQQASGHTEEKKSTTIWNIRGTYTNVTFATETVFPTLATADTGNDPPVEPSGQLGCINFNCVNPKGPEEVHKVWIFMLKKEYVKNVWCLSVRLFMSQNVCVFISSNLMCGSPVLSLSTDHAFPLFHYLPSFPFREAKHEFQRTPLCSLHCNW